MIGFRIFFILLILLPKTSFCFGKDGHINLNYNFQEECCKRNTLPPPSQESLSTSTECCIDIPFSLDLLQRQDKVEFSEQEILFLQMPLILPPLFVRPATHSFQNSTSALKQIQTIVLQL